MSEIDPQEFGRLQAQVETLIASDVEKTAILKALASDMQAIRLQLAEASGGWRLLVGLGGACASLGGGLAWLVHEFFKRTP